MADVASAFPTPSQSSFDAMLAPSKEQLDETIASMKEKSDKMWERADEAASTIRASRAAVDKLEPPKLLDLPKAPEPKMRDPLEAFGSTASIIGMLASTLTRRPLVHALNAATGVMNAYRQQDLQEADLQFKTFKSQMENAKTLHDWQNDIYKSALDKMDKDQKTALAELQAYASAFKDDNMLALLQSRQIGDIYKYIQSSNEQWAKMQGIVPRLEELDAKQRLETEWLQANPGATIDQRIAKHNEIWSPSVAAATVARDRKSEITPSQEMDDARQYFNTLWPVNSLTNSRNKVGADGEQIPAPEFNAWLANEWPKLKETFYQQRSPKPQGPVRGYVNGLPVAGEVVAPAATAKPTASAKPESDFIPVPASLKDAKDGTIFQDTKGTYGKSGAYWIIRGGKAFPTAAPQAPNPGGGGSPAAANGGQGGEDEEVGGGTAPLKPAPIANAQARAEEILSHYGPYKTLSNEQKAEIKRQFAPIIAHLDAIDPTGQMMPNAKARDIGIPNMRDATATIPQATALDMALLGASDEAYREGRGAPIARESELSRALQGMEPVERGPLPNRKLSLRQLDPTVAADLDRMFPAKPGERSFADINRAANTLGQVNQDQAQQFAELKGDIKGEHDRQLKNTKLLQMAWNASPARRKEILAQLEGGFGDATYSQKLEIVKLYIASLMQGGATEAATAATR